MEKLRVIFVGQNEIEEFKEKMDFFQKTPAVPQVSQIHTANYDSLFFSEIPLSNICYTFMIHVIITW